MFSGEVLKSINYNINSDDFIFDNQILVQAVWMGLRIGEIACPASYFPEASSINFQRSVTYGVGVLGAAARFRLARLGLLKPSLLEGLE